MLYQQDSDRFIGENVRRCRKALGLSQAQLGEELDRYGFTFRQQTILKIESGSRPLKFAEAIILARVLQVPIEVLAYEQSDTDDGELRARLVEQLLRINQETAETQALLAETEDRRMAAVEQLHRLREDGQQTADSILALDKATASSDG